MVLVLIVSFMMMLLSLRFLHQIVQLLALKVQFVHQQPIPILLLLEQLIYGVFQAMQLLVVVQHHRQLMLLVDKTVINPILYH